MRGEIFGGLEETRGERDRDQESGIGEEVQVNHLPKLDIASQDAVGFFPTSSLSSYYCLTSSRVHDPQTIANFPPAESPLNPPPQGRHARNRRDV